MRMPSHAIAGFAFAGVLTSCIDGIPAPTAPANQATNAALIANAIAVAMASREVRESTRDDLRASLFVEHRLDLQAYLATGNGRKLLAAGAAGVNMSVAHLERVIGSLPRMALYLPFNRHRTTWAATDDIVVGATMDEDVAPARVHSVGGAVVAAALGAAGPPLLILEPEETFSLRIHPQASTAGSVIQDPDDGRGGGYVRRYDATGKLVSEVQLSTLAGFRRRRVAPTTGTGMTEINGEMSNSIWWENGSARDNNVDTTYIHTFETNHDLDFGSSMEIKFFVYYFNTLEQVIMHEELRAEDVERDTEYTWDFDIMARRMTSGDDARIDIVLREDDIWSDDEMGVGNFSYGDNWNTNGNYAKTISQGSQATDISLKWTTKSAVSGPTLPTVSGYGYVSPYVSYTWTVANVSGGTSPYTYEWYIDGEYRGSGSSLYTDLGSPNDTYDMEFLVFDQIGLLAYSEMFIVTANGGSCDPTQPGCEEMLRAAPPEKVGRVALPLGMTRGLARPLLRRLPARP